MTLSYSNPKVFFSGAFPYRSVRVLLGAAICLLMAAGFACAASAAPVSPIPFRILFGSFAAAAVATGIYLAYLFAVRRTIQLRVTEDGIEYAGREHAWTRIARVDATYANGGVVLRIVTRGFPSSKSFPTLPAMTEAQFKTLIADLRESVLARYPELELDGDVRSE